MRPGADQEEGSAAENRRVEVRNHRPSLKWSLGIAARRAAGRNGRRARAGFLLSPAESLLAARANAQSPHLPGRVWSSVGAPAPYDEANHRQGLPASPPRKMHPSLFSGRVRPAEAPPRTIDASAAGAVRADGQRHATPERDAAIAAPVQPRLNLRPALARTARGRHAGGRDSTAPRPREARRGARDYDRLRPRRHAMRPSGV